MYIIDLLSRYNIKQIFVNSKYPFLQLFIKNYGLKGYENKNDNLLMYSIDLDIFKRHRGNIYLIWDGSELDFRDKYKLDMFKTIITLYKKINHIVLSNNVYNILWKYYIDASILDLDLYEKLEYSYKGKYSKKVLIFDGYNDSFDTFYNSYDYLDYINNNSEYEYIYNSLIKDDKNVVYSECRFALCFLEFDNKPQILKNLEHIGLPIICDNIESNGDIIVSIILPTYNGMPYLIESVNSILNQSYKNIELIIVDDGSIDNTEMYISGIIDNRIKYYYKDNGGTASAINYGLCRSVGKYITWTSSDNIYDRCAIEVMLKNIDNYGMVYTGYRSFGNGNDNVYHQNLGNSLEFILNFSGCPCFLWKREIVIETGNFDESLGGVEDYDYLIRYLEIDNNIKYIDEILYSYRIHDNSITCITYKNGNFNDVEEKLVEKMINRHGGYINLEYYINNNVRLIFKPEYIKKLILSSRIFRKYVDYFILNLEIVDNFSVLV